VKEKRTASIEKGLKADEARQPAPILSHKKAQKAQGNFLFLYNYLAESTQAACIYSATALKKRPSGARASSRGWSEAEPPDLSPQFLPPRRGRRKTRENLLACVGKQQYNNIRILTTLRPSGARKAILLPGVPLRSTPGY